MMDVLSLCILPCFWGEAVLGDMLMIHQYNNTSAYSNTALGSKALYNQRFMDWRPNGMEYLQLSADQEQQQMIEEQGKLIIEM
jgi:hypothetical protein